MGQLSSFERLARRPVSLQGSPHQQRQTRFFLQADPSETVATSDRPVFPNEGTVECHRHGAEDETNHNPSPQIGVLRFVHFVHHRSIFLGRAIVERFVVVGSSWGAGVGLTPLESPRLQIIQGVTGS